MSLKFHPTISPDFQFFANTFENIAEIFEDQGTIIQQGRNIIKKIELGGYSLVVKSFRKPSLLQGIIYKYFRKSKARRSYEYALKLLDKGFSTPQPVAYIEQSSWLKLERSYFISLYLPHVFTIREVLNQDTEDTDNILRQFAAFTYHLHESGILHLDHSPGNTLIDINGGNYQFSLVDINRMQFGSTTLKTRLKNLTRLSKDTDSIKKIAEFYAEASNINVEHCNDVLYRGSQRHFKKMAFRKYLKKSLTLKRQNRAK